MTKYKIILLGFGEMGPYSISGLLELFHIICVVVPALNTRFRTSAVKKTESIAKENNIPIILDPGLEGLHELVEDKKPDCVVICTYDKIISEKTINLTKFVNVHHGDLPRYRGRANLNWAIINGRETIGLSVHKVTPILDDGPVYKNWQLPILDEDYISDLYAQINDKIRNNLPNIIMDIIENRIQAVPQKGKPTYCCTRLPEDGKIKWNESATDIRNLIRAVSKPFPGAYTYFTNQNGTLEKLIIWRADIPVFGRKYEGNIPGRIGRKIKGVGVEVLTGTEPLIITDVNYRGVDLPAEKVINGTSITLK